jgi:hypothetical protein
MDYLEITQIFYKAFDYFNEKYCENFLKKPLIVILSRGRKNCLGWHWADKWSNDSEVLTEIMIAAERLNRPWEQLLETLLHEMAHLHNSQNQIKDCNAQQYHNKAFKKTAESIFHLTVTRDGQKGYAITDLSETSRADVFAFMEAHQLSSSINLKRITPVKGVAKKQFNINITEEDYQWFANLKESLDMSSKECFEYIREQSGLTPESVEIEEAC